VLLPVTCQLDWPSVNEVMVLNPQLVVLSACGPTCFEVLGSYPDRC
jgi:hypothetical protein